MSVSVEKKPFGVTKDGEAVSAYCIKNEALAVEIMEYGAAIRSLRVHHGGAWTDAVLGYDTLREYEKNDGYLPEKILTHESVAYWDYYLTNYDENGNARISPKKTTYNLNEEKQTQPSYSPDAVLPKNGKAAVTILFNYNTDEEKEWFDGIRKLELVEYNEQKNTINSSLVFDSEKNVAHGQGRVGQLTIQTGQSNFSALR